MPDTSVIQDIRHRLAPELLALNKAIEEALHSPNELLNGVVSHYLTVKGKQIRPLLVILAAKLLGRPNDKTIRCAASVEILHNSTLIHDDVVDDSLLRRGRPTVNSIWDNRIAVLVGDYFVSIALQEAASTGLPRIVDVVGRLGRLLTLGELDQIYTARHHTLSIDQYFTVIDRKTASLFEACVEVGACSVGGSQTDIDLLMRWAHILGECFQIRDDIFDYYPQEDTLGKPTGNDLREGKVTLPLLYALTEAAPDAETAEMTALTTSDALDAQQIQRLIQYARRRGGIEYAYRRMDDLRHEADELLQPFAGIPAAEALTDLLHYCVRRDA